MGAPIAPLRKNPLASTAAVAALCLLALAGCTGTAIDDVLLLRGDAPDSAFTRCKTRKLESLSEGFTTVDQLACDCQAIDGRAPECWGYPEYSGRPMPLALKAESGAVRQTSAGGPQIPLDGVVNAASFAHRTLPAGGIAQGSIFSIFGGDLGPIEGVGAASFPLGTELAGVSVRVFTLEGAVQAIPLFVRADQINAIMPSDTPLGFVAVEVSFNGKAGNVTPARIEPAAVGIFTTSSAGLGPASVTNFVTPENRPPNGPTTSATPGQVVTVWATGLGGIDGPDGAERTIFLTDEGDTEIFGGGFPSPGDPPPPPLFFNPGDYRIVGPGGSQVGPIDTTVNLSPLPAWSNKPSLQRIRRRDGFRAVWSGGSADQFVLLLGTAGNGIDKANASFVCSALGSAGMIDVPAYVLANFPPSPFLEDGGLVLFTSQTLGTFNASGLDSGSVSITVMDAIPVLFE